MSSKLVTPAHVSKFQNPKQNANAAIMVRRHVAMQRRALGECGH
jgi:hypothetical protein